MVSRNSDYDKASPVKLLSFLDDQEAFAQAEKDREDAETKLRDHKPFMGEVFENAERSLTSLVRIASAIEGSLYRAIRELERMKAGQSHDVNDNAIIDAETDEDK